MRRTKALHAGPRRGSLAAADARLPEGRFVSVFSTQALGFAIDHLKAWQLLVLGGSHPAFAQMTLVRGSIEGAVTSRWLTDASAAASARVSRGVAAALDDYDERRKFENAAGVPAPEPGTGAKSGGQRMAELREARDRAQVAEVRYPPTTELVRQYGAEEGATEWLYRLVSAFAHAKQWSIHAMDKFPTQFGHPALGIQSGRVEASDQVVLFATMHAVDLLDVAISEFEAYTMHPRSLRAWVLGR